MNLVRFQPEHLLQIKVQPGQATSVPQSQEYAAAVASSGLAYTLMDRQGTPIACGGLFRQWEGRYVAWAIITDRAPMIQIHRAAQRILGPCAFRRVECWVEVDFPQGKRWARMLGFHREGLMTAFSPEGSDMELFARVE